MKPTYSHLDLDERRKIERWHHAGVSIDVIAEKLGRHRSTIFREIARKMKDPVARRPGQMLMLSTSPVSVGEQAA